MSAGTVWVLIPLAAIFAGFVLALLRGRGSAAARAELESLRAAMAARDTAVVSLEERVRVLERIVTDRSTALRDEIERLRA